MVEAGKYNELRIVKILDFGAYLDGGEEFGEILLPTKWIPDNAQVDDLVKVFLYFDSEDRIIATSLVPFACVGDFAYLKIKAVNKFGAFADWGLDKDLMIPFKEQNAKMIEGRNYLLYLYIDPRTRRIVASARLERFLDVEPADYQPGQEVDLLIWIRSDLGYKAIINHKHQGMLYGNEIFRDVGTGMQMKGFVKQIRPDGKIDLILEKPGYEKVDELSDYVLKIIGIHGGFLELNDKSPAEDIYAILQMSKKNFKKAIGSLYKKRLIQIEEEGIRLS